MIVTDNDGNVSAVHGATERLTGVTAADLIGEPLGQILDLPDDVARLTPGALAGTTGQAEIAGDEISLPVLYTASALGGHGSHAFVFVATDMSQIRQLEVELQRAHRSLSQSVSSQRGLRTRSTRRCSSSATA